MIKLINIMNEANGNDPSKSALQDCKALFTSYVNTTNNKSSLERLHKRKNDSFIKKVLDGQKFPSGRMYRGIVNWKRLQFKEGKNIEFGFEGWSTNKRTATGFAGGSTASKEKGVLFVMNKLTHPFINIKSFGDSLQNEIERLRPKYDFTNKDLNKVYKAAEQDPLIEKLHELYYVADIGKHGRNESETVTEPQLLTITKVEEGNITIVYVE